LYQITILVQQVLQFNSFFFAGVAGAGMSAIAQFLAGTGKKISGSDRLFNQPGNEKTKLQLEAEQIICFDQLEARINETHNVLVVSTAIEDTNVEVARAKELNIPIVTRAQILAQIVATKRSIAIAGTSGKSTTAAMLFHLLQNCGVDASLITGAGIVTLIKQGKIGNCHVGKTDWLIIEADESDGSLVQYKPEVGVLLSIDKDHKELSELDEIFATFKNNITGTLICNFGHALARKFSVDAAQDFGKGSSLFGEKFEQNGFNISFLVNDNEVNIPTIGEHNMENALACFAVAKYMNIPLEKSSKGLEDYPGIYRRHQLLFQNNKVTIIDDYAHNPAKIFASIKACQPVGTPLLAWFQPHGYGPTRFIRKELVASIQTAFRPEDSMWMSEIYYAGGTAVKDISAGNLINDLLALDIDAHFIEDRDNLFAAMQAKLSDGAVILLMGARDPGLEKFAKEFAQRFQ
jgi:UDP-N-acetylmuramate--alanine ligase